MTYLVLARKWRPRRFDEMVGQEHVVRALTNALTAGRVHHAFLFTGTRGVGKTTVARIFAKSLNCETGVTATPCGRCSACLEVDQGRFVDLIEVDAASRTKVEDTRELLENAQYAPARGRTKVYLIDEVHMLSAHSFNALLKTLEEPPGHVKFLLATTDPQKLPITVVSRCLQFHLKRLPLASIVERLRAILVAESVEFETAALPLLARAADGSLRDALSLLDQALAFGAGRVLDADVRAMLGTIDRDHVRHLLDALADGDAGRLVGAVRALDEHAPDHDQVLAEIATLLERVALRQVAPEAEGDVAWDPATVESLARRIAPEDVQLWWQIALHGRRDLAYAPEPRTGFEMTLLRMLAFRPEAGGESAAALDASRQPAPARAPAPAACAPVAEPDGDLDWQALVARLGLGGLAEQLAANCAWLGRERDTVRLRVPPASAALRTASTEERLKQALARHFGTALRVSFEVGELEPEVETPARRAAREAASGLAAARTALDQDPTVRALQERFGATVQPDSVRTLR